MWTISSGRSSGLTLVEVLAGLALMGTLLVGLITARSRLVLQAQRAEQKIELTERAESLLSEWWQNPAGFPIDAEGTLTASGDGAGSSAIDRGERSDLDEREENDEGVLAWRTTLTDSVDVERLGAQRVRAEFWIEGKRDVEVSLELLLPGGTIAR